MRICKIQVSQPDCCFALAEGTPGVDFGSKETTLGKAMSDNDVLCPH